MSDELNSATELAALKAGQGEAVAIKSHGAWDGLDVLADLPDGTHLYTAPPASADTVSIAPGATHDPHEAWLTDPENVPFPGGLTE